MTRPSLAGIEQRAEVFRLHVPVSRCDTWEHGSSCPGVERCKNCRRRWPCTFITDAEAALIAHTRTDLPNNDCPVSAQIPTAVVDEDGFCSEHGWDCDDFRTHIDLTDPEGDPT